MSCTSLPSWLPVSAGDIKEEAAQAALHKLQRCQVHLPLLRRTLQTVYFETAAATARQGNLHLHFDCMHDYATLSSRLC